MASYHAMNGGFSMDLLEKPIRSNNNTVTASHINHNAASSLLSMSAASVSRFEGANAKLLLSMMECLDTCSFSDQQAQNWTQLRERIRMAAETKTDICWNMSRSDSDAMEQYEPTSSNSRSYRSQVEDKLNGLTEGRLHREASIQDVLACLLDQKSTGPRTMTTSAMSDGKNRNELEARPSLKTLLSSNDFTQAEKKESLRHLLSFIDSSFSSEPEIVKEAPQKLQRLSSLDLMRSLLSPQPSMQSMPGRTTSFEIIHAMLNANTNQAIQKPMSSQDSFRFQHLANVLEAMEGHVGGYDTDVNEDYGNEEVVAVENLDNLLEYHGPSSTEHSAPSTSNGGYVESQTVLNPSRSIYNELRTVRVSDYQANNQHSGSGMYHGTMNQIQNQEQCLGNVSGNEEMALAYMRCNNPTSGMYSYHNYSNSADNNNIPMTPAKPSNSQHYYMPQGSLPIPRIVNNTPNAMNVMSSGLAPKIKQESFGYICSALGCNHVARIKGLCKLHGGGGRRCKVEGCLKSAQTGHLCIAHGGGKPCNVQGCQKTAQSRGLCKLHGGGVRCKFDGCTKSCQSGGFCRGHGGGKRCEFINCTKWAQKNGHCAKHAQEMAQKMGLR